MSEWKQDQTPPDVFVVSNCIFVEAPISDMEADREYCEITHTRPDSTEVILDWGDIEYPFDGATFLLTGLAPGDHTITASAQYENVNDTISKPADAVTTTFTVPAMAAPSDTDSLAPGDLPEAPKILKQSPCAAPRKWVLLQTPLLPNTIDVKDADNNSVKYSLRRCKLVRTWINANGAQKHTVIAGAKTAKGLAANPILDNKKNKPPVNGATYKAVGIYVNPTANPKRQVLPSKESVPVQFP